MNFLLELLLIFLLSCYHAFEGNKTDIKFYTATLPITHGTGAVKQKKIIFENVLVRNRRNDEANLKECRTCGYTFEYGKTAHSGKIKPLIIRGDEVKPPYKYPWMVALQKDSNTECGGSLISNRFVLTAAHCLLTPAHEVLPASDISIGLLTQTTDTEKGPPVKAVHLHPDFDVKTMVNDIGLLELASGITCNIYRNPICLPPSDYDVKIDEEFEIAGWGVTNVTLNEVSKTLQEAKISNKALSVCKDCLPLNLEDSTYCLVGLRNQTPCSGDSGGPMFKKIHNKYHIFGVTSLHSSGTCDTNCPFVYTSVIKHEDWIISTTGSLHIENYISPTSSAVTEPADVTAPADVTTPSPIPEYDFMSSSIDLWPYGDMFENGEESDKESGEESDNESSSTLNIGSHSIPDIGSPSISNIDSSSISNIETSPIPNTASPSISNTESPSILNIATSSIPNVGSNSISNIGIPPMPNIGIPLMPYIGSPPLLNFGNPLLPNTGGAFPRFIIIYRMPGKKQSRRKKFPVSCFSRSRMLRRKCKLSHRPRRIIIAFSCFPIRRKFPISRHARRRITVSCFPIKRKFLFSRHTRIILVSGFPKRHRKKFLSSSF